MFYWKLRIPLLLVVMGFVSSLFQKFPNLFLSNASNFIRSAMFIGLIGIILFVLERSKVNEKKVHFLIGVGLILFAVTFDYIMV